MKVDIQSLDSAHEKLGELLRRIEVVAHRTSEAERVLGQYRIGSMRTTDQITNNLNSQIRAMEENAYVFLQLSQVLQNALEEYEQCEDQIRWLAGTGAVVMAAGSAREILDQIGFVQPIMEKEMINQYIMPLIATGK